MLRDLLVGLLGGGIASLLTAAGALYLLKAQREKLRAESGKLVAETESVEAGASEKITQTALKWLAHYEKELKAHQSERLELNSRVADLEGQVEHLSSDLDKAMVRISDLETENKDLRTGVRILSKQIVEEFEAIPAWPHWCP
jgi:chromosome segregation ATPase